MAALAGRAEPMRTRAIPIRTWLIPSTGMSASVPQAVIQGKVLTKQTGRLIRKRTGVPSGGITMIAPWRTGGTQSLHFVHRSMEQRLLTRTRGGPAKSTRKGCGNGFTGKRPHALKNSGRGFKGQKNRNFSEISAPHYVRIWPPCTSPESGKIFTQKISAQPLQGFHLPLPRGV